MANTPPMNTATVPYMVRLGLKTIKRIKTIAKKKEVPFSTMCRLLINERLDELGVESPASANTPERGSTPHVSILG